MNSLYLSDFINQAPGLVTLKDTRSVIMACSPMMTKLAGFEKPSQIQGLTDYDMRCDAVAGAEQFRLQDQLAITHGEHLSINVYTYDDGCKVVMFGEKKVLKCKDEVIGVYAAGHDLAKLNTIANQFLTLLDSDGKFLTCREKQSFSYEITDSYHDEPLTRAESMCFFYVLRGKSNKEIAKLLGLSSRTIDGRVESIKQKLNCRSKYQLIEYAQQRGYLSVILKKLLNNDHFSLSLS